MTPGPVERYPTECECDVVLLDGTPARIRPIVPSDTDRLTHFHEHLSRETVYRRFFSAHPHLRPEELARFTRVDYRERLALIALVGDTLVAVARYDRAPFTARAEVAFVVADAFQGHGLGTLLLEHLASAARRRGISTFEAETLSINHPMLDVFGQTGFPCERHRSEGVIEVSFPISPIQAYLDAVIERDLLATRAALQPWLDAIPPADVSAVCQGWPAAQDWTAICESHRLDASAPVVAGAHGIDVNSGLAYLASHPGLGVIVVDLASVARPRRLVALARHVARHRPVLAFVSDSDALAWCQQAGLETRPHLDVLADRARELMAEAQSGTWQPPQRGPLVAPEDCAVSEARMFLDGVLDADAPSPRVQQLAPEITSDLLSAYRVSAQSLRGNAWRLTLENEASAGLVARASGREDEAEPGVARLLPLTDRDVADLVGPAGVVGPAADLLADAVSRMSRLIDDQPDIHCIRLGTWPPGAAADAAAGAAAIWTGPGRGTEDDPFVRRLAASRVQPVTDEWRVDRRK